jgi:hypothetical protein
METIRDARFCFQLLSEPLWGRTRSTSIRRARHTIVPGELKSASVAEGIREEISEALSDSEEGLRSIASNRRPQEAAV